MMNKPTHCVLWAQPELVSTGHLQERFELLRKFDAESHWWRYLLRCRECGQAYLFEFYEEIDWQDGDDPQFQSWIPVAPDEDLEKLKQAWPGDLRSLPGLHVDRPKGARAKNAYWVWD